MNTQVIQPRPPKPRRGAFDALRPVVMAAALLVVLVLAALAAAWLTGTSGADGHTLTVERPVGGTLTGNGIECGTGGTSCSTPVRDGQDVQLHPEADEGYMFTGFTGDCRSTGRLLMKRDATCGARFDRTSATAATTPSGTPTGERRWPLTLTPPENGTIVTVEGHECGPSKKACTVEVLEGTIVSLEVMTEPGHRVQSYTGDCVDGTANMTQARSCGVVLVKGDGPGPGPIARNTPPSSPPGKASTPSSPGSSTRPAGPAVKPPATATGQTAGPGTPPPTAVAVTGTSPGAPPVAPPVDTPAPPPTTAREGDREAAEKLAKTDILRVLKAYRTAYERMDVAAMKRLQPGLNVPSHELQFGDLKWVKYTFGGDPEIEDLDVVRGEARAIVDLKTENEHKSGKKQKPAEGKVTYLLKRIRETPDWDIVLVKYDMKK